MVTASDGSPTYGDEEAVERAAAPRRRRSAISGGSGIDQPWSTQQARPATLLRPTHAGHRQVDLAGDDDQRHRQRDQQDRRDVEEQEVSVSGPSKLGDVEATSTSTTTSSAITAVARLSSSRAATAAGRTTA